MNQGIHIMEHHGIGQVDMNITEIYKTQKDTIWNDSKTFLMVFDKRGRQIADYDFYTGLQMIQKDDEIIIFIDNKDLVSGRWKFFGTKIKIVESKIISENIFSEGVREGNNTSHTFFKENPWGTQNTNIEYVSFNERKKRIKICRSCPFFVHSTGECSVDGKNVIESTKIEKSYCPEEKWGSKEKSIILIEDEKQADIMFQQNQKEFEDELEEYLKNGGSQ
jgi:hypothetical protein